MAETIAHCAGFADHTKCATTANDNHGNWASCEGGGKGTNPDACNFFSSLYWLGDANAYEKALAERGVPFDTEIDRVSVKDVLNLLGEKREIRLGGGRHTLHWLALFPCFFIVARVVPSCDGGIQLQR